MWYKNSYSSYANSEKYRLFTVNTLQMDWARLVTLLSAALVLANLHVIDYKIFPHTCTHKFTVYAFR